MVPREKLGMENIHILAQKAGAHTLQTWRSGFDSWCHMGSRALEATSKLPLSQE